MASDAKELTTVVQLHTGHILKIRPLTEADLDSQDDKLPPVLQLDHDCSTALGGAPDGRDVYLAWLKNPKAWQSFVAELQIGDQAVFAGTALLKLPESDTAYIYSVAVCEEHRKKGVGLQLVKNMANHAKQRGCRFIVFKTFAADPKDLTYPGTAVYQHCAKDEKNFSIVAEQRLLDKRYVSYAPIEIDLFLLKIIARIEAEKLAATGSGYPAMQRAPDSNEKKFEQSENDVADTAEVPTAGVTKKDDRSKKPK